VRRAPRLLAVALLWAALTPLAAGAAQPAAAPCPGGRAQGGDLGLRGVACTGPAAACAIHVDDDGDRRHEFSVEPVVTEVAEGSAAAGRIVTGDVLVAVDGLLITTAEGGRRLANLSTGQPVAVRLRRQGRTVEVVLTPRPGCGLNSLRVRR